MVRALLAMGVDISSQDNAGMTALHMAAMCSFSDVAAVLMENGANVNAQGNAGFRHFAGRLSYNRRT